MDCRGQPEQLKLKNQYTMKKMRVSIVVSSICLVILLTGGLTGCYYDKEERLYRKPGAVDCATISAKYSTDVAPLVKNKCATAGCHDAATAAGGSVLEVYSQVSGAAARINQRCVIEQTMPPGGALTPGEIAILSCWINSGAPNN
jgi:uncharacterized membrane protein